MLTTFELIVGGGHASAHLDISRCAPATARRHLGAVALALVTPVVVLLTSAAMAGATGNSGLDLLGRSAVDPPVAVVIVVVFPLIALLLLAAARLRVSIERAEDAWHGRVSLQLARLELAAAILCLLLVGGFVAHLVADGFACLRGVSRAC